MKSILAFEFSGTFETSQLLPENIPTFVRKKTPCTNVRFGRKLMSELEKLRFQVDAWTSGSEPDESRLDVLEVC